MHPPAQAAIGAGNHVLPSDQTGETVDDQIRVRYHVGRMADHARDRDFSLRQLAILLHAPFVFMSHVAGLERVGLCVDRQHDIDNIRHRDSGGDGGVAGINQFIDANRHPHAGAAAIGRNPGPRIGIGRRK
jgi:hypothetical protein